MNLYSKNAMSGMLNRRSTRMRVAAGVEDNRASMGSVGSREEEDEEVIDE